MIWFSYQCPFIFRFTLKPSGDIFVKSALSEGREYSLTVNARDQGDYYFSNQSFGESLCLRILLGISYSFPKKCHSEGLRYFQVKCVYKSIHQECSMIA